MPIAFFAPPHALATRAYSSAESTAACRAPSSCVLLFGEVAEKPRQRLLQLVLRLVGSAA
jgi:hypothetical protein